jgi:predicted dehydrogenase
VAFAFPSERSTVQQYRTTRRDFLRGTGSATAAIACPTIIPASALGRNGAVAPSERIVMGAIGVGGRGAGVLRVLLGRPDVQVVAVCDVAADRLAAAKALVASTCQNDDCAAFADLRELLSGHPDLDAVLIATGDRWHAPAAVMAMTAGMDVYCEKPGSMTIAEGRAVADTAQRYGRVFQTGAQRLSEPNFIY